MDHSRKHLTEDDLERENNVIELIKNKPKLELVTGGKGPPNSNSNDWLSSMLVGTIFLIKEKNNPMDFKLGQFQKIGETERSVVLMTEGVDSAIFVDPASFCNKYRLFESMGVVTKKDIEELKKEKEEQQEDKDE